MGRGDVADASSEATVRDATSGEAAVRDATWDSPTETDSGSPIDAGTCPPAATRCAADGLQTCGSDGNWGAVASCPASAPICEAGACVCHDTLCGASCVDLQTDNANCGGCGLACSTTCTAGECIVQLGAGPGAYGMALEGGNVFWADGQVVRTPKSGGVSVDVAQNQAQVLAADTRNVYWTDGDWGVFQVPVEGGATVTLADDQGVIGAMAADGTNVYWVNGTYLVSTTPGGGTFVTLATASFSSYGMAVDDTSVYCSALDGTLLRVPKGGGTPVTLGVAPSTGSGLGVAVDSANAYWSDGFAVEKVPLAGGTAVTLVANTGPRSIATDGTNVYWGDDWGGTQPGVLMKVSVAGGAPTTLVSDAYATAIAVDSTSVYWLNSGGVFKLTPK